jgi:hypothetical protein
VSFEIKLALPGGVKLGGSAKFGIMHIVVRVACISKAAGEDRSVMQRSVDVKKAHNCNSKIVVQ